MLAFAVLAKATEEYYAIDWRWGPEEEGRTGLT
jgi:hypothetical protein